MTAGRAAHATSPDGAPDDRGWLGVPRRHSTRTPDRLARWTRGRLALWLRNRLSTWADGRPARWVQGPVGIWALRAVALGFILLIVTTGHAQIDRAEVSAPTRADRGRPPRPGVRGDPSSARPASGAAGARIPTPGRPGDGHLGRDGWTRWRRGGTAPLPASAPPVWCCSQELEWPGSAIVGAGGKVAFLVAMAVTPFFREALGNYYHPEDVLALGFLLLSLALIGDRHSLGAGACLGLAIGCKQWALLALPPLVVTAGGRQARCKLVGAAAGSSALVYLPLMLAAPQYRVEDPEWAGGGSGRVCTPDDNRGDAPQGSVSYPSGRRGAPGAGSASPLRHRRSLVLVAAALDARLDGNRDGVRPVSFDQVLRLVLICLAFRLVADCIALSYYALPLVVLVAIVDSRRSNVPVLAIGSGLALAFWYGSGAPGFILDPWIGALVFTAGIAAIVVRTLAVPRAHPTTVSA